MNNLTIRDNAIQGKLLWAGILLIAVVGLIHLIESPEHFEAATYLGLLFLANFAGAAVAAYGIYKRLGWGWALGALVAGGAFVMYIVSRTVGLPSLTEAELFEPMGVASLVVEGLFVGLYLAVFVPRRRTSLKKKAH
jgi:hypothetical protein